MLRWMVAVLLIGGALPGEAQLADQMADEIKAGVPVVGVDVGVALPISTYQQTADPGGSVAPFVAYQIGTGSFAVSPIIQGQFAGFTEGDAGGGTPSITSVAGGLRFSLFDEKAEVYFGAQGGYYWTTSGPLLHDSGNGFNINGGVNYDCFANLGLGLFARYDQARICPAKGSGSCTTEFLTTGLEARYRFLPPPPAPPPPPPPAPPPPPPPPVKKKIILRGVNFDFDKANIRADAVPILDEAASTLKEYGEITVKVDGYTDSVGTDAYNQRLSVRRANAVREYLERLGVSGARMTAQGFGERNPVASNETAEGRAQNRRVELIVNQ